jgi:hypothetical protein
MSGRSELIIYRGRIVAIAGPRRVQFVDGLDPIDLRFVAAMALCKREVDEGRIAGPFTSELAARWARLMLVGPHNAAKELSDHELAERIDVPEDQVVLARAEFKYRRPAFG